MGRQGKAHEKKSKRNEAAVVRMICLAEWFFSKENLPIVVRSSVRAEE